MKNPQNPNNLIGFDDLLKLLEVPQTKLKTDFPPHNLVKTGENTYTLTIAIVGRNQDEIDITLEQNVLIVSGDSIKHPDDYTVLQNGIAFRSFKKEFRLHDHIEIVSAKLLNGLLHIKLLYNIPKSLLPTHIKIN